MMLGEKLSAKEAHALDMIYKAVEDDKFEEELALLASKLSKLPTKALGMIKRAINSSIGNDLGKQLAIEEQLQFAASQTSDYKEGVAAFLEKRKANFKGK